MSKSHRLQMMNQIFERFLTSKKIFIKACILPKMTKINVLTESVRLWSDEATRSEKISLNTSNENITARGTTRAAMLIRLLYNFIPTPRFGGKENPLTPKKRVA